MKEAEIHRKEAHIQSLQHEFQQATRDSEKLVVKLQQGLKQKHEVIRSKDEAVQEKKRQIQELQQRQGDRKDGSISQLLRLQWEGGPKASFGTYGHSVSVRKGMVYFADCVTCTRCTAHR